MQSEGKGNRPYIEAIKLVAGSVQYKNLSIKATFIDAISQLYQYYTNFGNIKYLETAALHIQAYLEMGFPYEDGRELYDLILEQLGTTRELKFPHKFYSAKKNKNKQNTGEKYDKEVACFFPSKDEDRRGCSRYYRKSRKKGNGCFLL